MFDSMLSSLFEICGPEAATPFLAESHVPDFMNITVVMAGTNMG